MLLLGFCIELSSRLAPLAVCAGMNLIIYVPHCLLSGIQVRDRDTQIHRTKPSCDRLTVTARSQNSVCQTDSNPQNSMGMSKWHPIPFIVHLFWPGPIGNWSKVEHYIGNRVPFGTHIVTQQQGEEDGTSLWVAHQTNQFTRHQLILCGWCGHPISTAFWGNYFQLRCEADNSVLYQLVATDL